MELVKNIMTGAIILGQSGSNTAVFEPGSSSDSLKKKKVLDFPPGLFSQKG